MDEVRAELFERLKRAGVVVGRMRMSLDRLSGVYRCEVSGVRGRIRAKAVGEDTSPEVAVDEALEALIGRYKFHNAPEP